MARRRFKPQVQDLCKLGTLAHNRAFTASEMREYGVRNAKATKAWLIRHKLVGSGERRGTLYPTAKGWRMIDKVCKR